MYMYKWYMHDKQLMSKVINYRRAMPRELSASRHFKIGIDQSAMSKPVHQPIKTKLAIHRDCTNSPLS